MKTVTDETEKKILVVDSKPFGQIKVTQEEVVHFPEGIFAFEGLQDYILIPTKKNLSFKWLQSVKEKNIAFLLTDPTELLPDYSPKVPKENLSLIGLEASEETQEINTFCIVTVPNHHPEQMTINLQGPILMNGKTMLAGQFVSEDDAHLVRQPLFELLGDHQK